ncbi:ribosome biogenesis GTPase Der [Candidatus Berkelbacteria bacterium RIFOXYA2_FULL_43_10]|uniref:GTPase Der n=1 Tax=Candidatus Berkelbacteria bacterium RIFOXYA2_FULL_43_10 TaxID=1797472 RepID=A0A1F5E9T5_9BACT|nr:MAG: ribosome biogenesis GTPase Der [Candidatus Berkelbacteria bacterium RIFOXYA2_FULL_43_10]
MSEANIQNSILVAIVGRPNVGKSTLFNRLIGKRQAIESKTPGTTRDRLYGELAWNGKKILLTDTAGIQSGAKEELLEQSMAATKLAIAGADLVLLLVDFREGLTDADFQIAKSLKRCAEKVIVVANKCDNKFESAGMETFRRLGFADIVPVSAISGKASGDLLDMVTEKAESIEIAKKEEELRGGEIKFTIVGRPNVGKSTLTNTILGREHMIVSKTPGTTRDTGNFSFKYKGKILEVVDTAGMRRKGKIDHDTVESFALIRSLKAIKESDLVVYTIDSQEKISSLDLNILGEIKDSGKSIILAVNKIDLWGEEREAEMAKIINSLQRELNFMPWVPVVFISAKDSSNINNLLNQIIKVIEGRMTEIDEDSMRDIFKDALAMNYQIGYIKYLRFERANPPVFKIKTLKNKKAHFSHLRYLENKIRDRFPYNGTPIFIDHQR